MLSRVGESMFWMSRYIERAENTSRYLDVNINMLLDFNMIGREDSAMYWEPLILISGDHEKFAMHYDHADAETVTDFLVFSRHNPNSIHSCIALARENARSIIESISSEMWEQVNNMYYLVQRATPDAVKRDPYSFFKEVKNASHLFQGIADGTLSRNESWDFVQAGKYLERADNTARVCDVKYKVLTPEPDAQDEPVDVIQWMAVLKSCSALEAFRKVHLSRIEPGTILNFLVLDRLFPRSISFATAMLAESLWRVSGSTRREYHNNADRLVGKLDSELAYTTIYDILGSGTHEYFANIEADLARIGMQVHNTYFAYHIPQVEYGRVEPVLEMAGLGAARAVWSQAEQQQQQQQQQTGAKTRE